jgi:thiazole synthase
MLRTSGCRYLTLNTHSIAEITRGDDLPVGYGNATFRSVREAFPFDELVPVLNVNAATTTTEAIERARRAHYLTGARTIKLEVLDDDLRVSVNTAVADVARTLLADGLEIWPLITPDPDAAADLESMGCAVIRVMGSRIGSGRGIDPRWLGSIRQTLDRVHVLTMFDGGVGQPAHASEALAMGFDSVLVNSCLFVGRDGPVAELQRFMRHAYPPVRRPPSLSL